MTSETPQRSDLQIPGYYYDPVKQKYFKVLPNHIAPEGVKYSREGVRREGERWKREKEEESVQRYRNTRIKHSAILRQPHAVGGLGREYDSLSRTSRRDVASRVWVEGMSTKYTLSFQPRTYPHLGRPSHGHNISTLIYDELTGSIIAGVNSDGGYGSNVFSWAPKYLEDGRKEFRESSRRQIGYYPPRSPIACLCLTPSRVLLSISVDSSDQGEIIEMTTLVTPDSSHNWDAWPILDPGVTLRLRPHRPITIFDVKASPSKLRPSTVASATEHGVGFFEESESGYIDKPVESYRSSSHVLALTWLSDNLLAAGSRDGYILFYDQRSGGNVLRLRHPSSVAHLRYADEHRIVAAGLENTLQTYDLRSSPLPSESSSGSYIYPGPKTHSPFPWTPPYITYPTYTNAAHMNLGFDVSPSLGLIAAAGEDKHIRMLELWTGKEAVRSFEGGSSGNAAGTGVSGGGVGTSGAFAGKVWSEGVRALEFFGEFRGGYGRGVGAGGEEGGLVVGSGPVVEEWGW